MSKCDHKNCLTPFCPLCGEAMQDGSPHALIAYLRSKQGSQEKRAISISEDIAAGNSRLSESNVRGSRKSAEKFGAWADWVESRLESQ